MSGLALVAHRLGASVTGSDRAESGYIDRLRAAGLEPVVGHDPSTRSAGRGGGGLDRDRPRQPGAGTRTRARPARPSPRSAPGRALRRGAPDRGCRHARQDDDDGNDRSRAPGDRSGSRPSSSAASCPERGTAASPPTPASASGELVVAEADESDASFLELRPRSQSSPTSSSTTTLAGARAPSSSRRSVGSQPRRAGWCAAPSRPWTESSDSLAPDARVERFDHSSPGPSPLELSVPGAPQRPECPCSPGGDRRSPARTSMARRRRLRASPACSAARSSRASAPARSSTTTTPITPRRSAPRSPRSASFVPGRLIAVFQPHLYSRTKALADEFGQALAAADEIGRARRLRGARGAGGPARGSQRPARRSGCGRPRQWPPRDVARRPRNRGARPGAAASAKATSSSRSAPATCSSWRRISWRQPRERRARFPARAADHRQGGRQRRALRAACNRSELSSCSRGRRGRDTRSRSSAPDRISWSRTPAYGALCSSWTAS